MVVIPQTDHIPCPSANIEVLVGASGKDRVDNGTTRVELDKYVIKVKVGDGKIRLKAAPAHALTGNVGKNRREKTLHLSWNYFAIFVLQPKPLRRFSIRTLD